MKSATTSRLSTALNRRTPPWLFAVTIAVTGVVFMAATTLLLNILLWAHPDDQVHTALLIMNICSALSAAVLGVNAILIAASFRSYVQQQLARIIPETEVQTGAQVVQLRSHSAF